MRLFSQTISVLSSPLDYLSESRFGHTIAAAVIYSGGGKKNNEKNKRHTAAETKAGLWKCQRRAVTSAPSAERPHERWPAATRTFSYLLLRRLSKCDPSDINFKRAADQGRQAALLLFRLLILLLCQSVFHILMDPASRSQSCRCIPNTVWENRGIQHDTRKHLQFSGAWETAFSSASRTNNPLHITQQGNFQCWEVQEIEARLWRPVVHS